MAAGDARGCTTQRAYIQREHEARGCEAGSCEEGIILLRCSVDHADIFMYSEAAFPQNHREKDDEEAVGLERLNDATEYLLDV